MMEPQGYALVTGASSGIGEEFARQLAARGWSLILTARSADRLEALRSELMFAHIGIDVLSIPLDLSVPGAAVELFQRVESAGLNVNLLINNAGFGAFGEFSSIDLDRQRRMITLNISSLVELSHLFMRPMVERKSGGIIQIASVAGFVPLPYCAVYAATKAFVGRFTEAVSEEARSQGVRVLVVHPGSTKTNFFRVAGKNPFSNPARMQTAAEVVRGSLRAFDHGKISVVTGASNRFLVRLMTLVPNAWILHIVGNAMRRAGVQHLQRSAYEKENV